MADEQPTTQEPSQEQATEVEATATNEPAETNPEEVAPEELPPEILRANLDRANSQAAAERVKRQEAIAHAQELEAKLADAKTKDEIETMVKEHTKALQEAHREADRARAALATGLPESMAARLVGDDFDAMLEDAKQLADLIGRPRDGDLRRPGGGVTPTEPPKKSEPGAEWRAAKQKHAP